MGTMGRGGTTATTATTSTTADAERIFAWAGGVLPALWAASRAAPYAPASADLVVVRTVALANVGLGRAIDSWWSALFHLLPLGTGVARASFASAIAAGIAGRLIYALARQLVRARETESRSTRLAPGVALIAATTATLGLPWQHAAAAPGGAALATLLILAPVAALSSERLAAEARLPLAILFTALAAGRDLGTGIVAVSSALLAALVFRRDLRAHLFKKTNAVALFLALLPPLEAWLRSQRSVSTLADDSLWIDKANPLLASLASSTPPASLSNPIAALVEANGALPLILSALGVASLVIGARRRTALFTALLLFVPAMAASFVIPGPPTSDANEAARMIAAAVASSLLAPALYLAVQSLRWTKDPRDLRRAPRATFLLLAEAVLPVHAADEGFAPILPADDGAFFQATAAEVPPHSMVLLQDRTTYGHLRALAARGETRSDVTWVPTFALASRTEETARAWQDEPKLLPLYSDVALRGTPDEASLSALASARRVIVDAEPAWGAPLLRHTTAHAALEDFHPESRGPSDRLRAFEALPMFDCTSPSTQLTRDPEALALVKSVVERRLRALAKLGEREVLEHATEASIACESR